MQPRTRRQKEVLEYVKQYIEKHGYEPSYQQIARHLGVSSKAGIAKHIEALENQGLISRVRESGSFRLEINPTESILELICEVEWLDVPKEETYAEEWKNKSLFVPRFLIESYSERSIRAFLVPNDSMLEEHICEGDVALIENRSYARDGDIIVALLENRRAVLKQFFRLGANIELRPANPNYDPIVLPADKIEIKGVLRGLLRPTQ
ncbi:MAG: transcriptional repressor LexA [Pyrinomonadaceae bacterium]